MDDTFTHINRQGNAYYLQCKTGSDGKPKYSFARKPTGSPVQDLPEGYEPREDPETAQVTLRKIRPTAIHPQEKLFLDQTIRGQKPELLFIVDVQDRSLVVYTAEMDFDARLGALGRMFPMDALTARRFKADMIGNARYQKVMRFTLFDADKRLFNMERWCFKGSIDTWIFIEGHKSLPALANQYVRHLGEESFFELM